MVGIAIAGVATAGWRTRRPPHPVPKDEALDDVIEAERLAGWVV